MTRSTLLSAFRPGGGSGAAYWQFRHDGAILDSRRALTPRLRGVYTKLAHHYASMFDCACVAAGI